MAVSNQMITMYLCKGCNKIYQPGAAHTCEDVSEVQDCTEETEVVTEAYENINEGDLDIDEVLISEIEKRPVLYDHRLPIQLRSRNKVQELWAEIEAVLGDFMPLDDLKKRWRSIRDRYLKSRKIQTTYIPSGSAKQPKEKPYKYYHLLSFLNDPSEKRKTYCSLKKTVSPLPSPSGSESSEIKEDCGKESASVSNAKSTPKRKKSNSEEIEAALLRKLNDSMDSTANVDDTDHFCKFLSINLKKLPQTKRFLLQMECMKLLHDAMNETV